MSREAGIVDRQIAGHCLFREGEGILAAVSGGVDSMVMLHLLHELAPAHGWTLAAAHFNHQLRGAESDADEAAASGFAAKLGLPFHAGRADVRSHAVTAGVSTEMSARELRHHFLAETARAGGCGCVALAHHQDDQVELFFLRLLRGTGNEGLAGMNWQNTSPADARVRLARPLLGQPRAWISAYARAHDIPFRVDASNADHNIPRNRVRGLLLPMLEEWQPGLRENVARCMEIARAEADLSASLAREWLAGGQKTSFEGLPVAVARRCLEFQLIETGIAPNFDLVESLRLNPGKIICVGPDRRISRGPAGGIYEISPENLGFDSSSQAVSIEGLAGQFSFGGVEINWRKVESGPDTFPDGRVSGIEHLDRERVGEGAVLRHWQPGDRFQPSGLAQAKKLQDLFSDLKVPQAERRRRVVAATLSGALFWVEGLRVGQGFKVSPDTKTRLEWRWQRPKTPIAGLLQEC